MKYNCNKTELLDITVCYFTTSGTPDHFLFIHIHSKELKLYIRGKFEDYIAGSNTKHSRQFVKTDATA